MSAARPHANRFSFVARKHAPYRLTAAANPIMSGPLTITGHDVTLECGHHIEALPHVMQHFIGRDRWACIECGREIARALPEFAGHDFSDAALAQAQP